MFERRHPRRPYTGISLKSLQDRWRPVIEDSKSRQVISECGCLLRWREENEVVGWVYNDNPWEDGVGWIDGEAPTTYEEIYDDLKSRHEHMLKIRTALIEPAPGLSLKPFILLHS